MGQNDEKKGIAKYKGLREGYVLQPIPTKKWLDPEDISWNLEQVIGKGTFGQVMKGTYKGKSVAIKIANPNNILEATDLLKEECSRMCRLQHEGIVHTFGCCVKENSFIMVMELLDQSLETLLEEIKKSKERLAKKTGVGTDEIHTSQVLLKNPKLFVPVWYILRDIMCGIQYLHDQQLMHRDVKSSNILLTKGEKRAKLCDFGLVRLLDLNSVSTMTNAGSSSYKAPEVHYGKGRYDTSVDIFSFGRVIEKDLCPFFSDNALKELSVYCTQAIPGTDSSFRQPCFRPTAKQVSDKIDCYIKNYNPPKTFSEYKKQDGAHDNTFKSVFTVEERIKFYQDSPLRMTRIRKKSIIASIFSENEVQDLKDFWMVRKIGSGQDNELSKRKNPGIKRKSFEKTPDIYAGIKDINNTRFKPPFNLKNKTEEPLVYIAKISKGGRYHYLCGHWGSDTLVSLSKALEMEKIPCSGCVDSGRRQVFSRKYKNMIQEIGCEAPEKKFKRTSSLSKTSKNGQSFSKSLKGTSNELNLCNNINELEGGTIPLDGTGSNEKNVLSGAYSSEESEHISYEGLSEDEEQMENSENEDFNSADEETIATHALSDEDRPENYEEQNFEGIEKLLQEHENREEEEFDIENYSEENDSDSGDEKESYSSNDEAQEHSEEHDTLMNVEEGDVGEEDCEEVMIDDDQEIQQEKDVIRNKTPRSGTKNFNNVLNPKKTRSQTKRGKISSNRRSRSKTLKSNNANDTKKTKVIPKESNSFNTPPNVRITRSRVSKLLPSEKGSHSESKRVYVSSNIRKYRGKN